MKVDLPHLIRQISDQPHRAALEQFLRRLQETVAGEHTLDELADAYCVRRVRFDLPPSPDEQASRIRYNRREHGQTEKP